MWDMLKHGKINPELLVGKTVTLEEAIPELMSMNRFNNIELTIIDPNLKYRPLRLLPTLLKLLPVSTYLIQQGKLRELNCQFTFFLYNQLICKSHWLKLFRRY
jgi:hypothetical protein